MFRRREKYTSAEDKEVFKKGNNKIESQRRRAAKRNKALLKVSQLFTVMFHLFHNVTMPS